VDEKKDESHEEGELVLGLTADEDLGGVDVEGGTEEGEGRRMRCGLVDSGKQRSKMNAIPVNWPSRIRYLATVTPVKVALVSVSG